MCRFPGQVPVEPSPVQRTNTSDEKTDSFSDTSREEPTGRARTDSRIAKMILVTYNLSRTSFEQVIDE